MAGAGSSLEAITVSTVLVSTQPPDPPPLAVGRGGAIPVRRGNAPMSPHAIAPTHPRAPIMAGPDSTRPNPVRSGRRMERTVQRQSQHRPLDRLLQHLADAELLDGLTQGRTAVT